MTWKLIITYLCGVATVPLGVLFLHLWWGYDEWKESRRYQKAWDKFTAEWDAMSTEAREEFNNTPLPYEHSWATPRDRYFAARWKHGHTTEV